MKIIKTDIDGPLVIEPNVFGDERGLTDGDALLDCGATRAVLSDVPVYWRVNLRRMLVEEKALG